jgi:hypothetical protein
MRRFAAHVREFAAQDSGVITESELVSASWHKCLQSQELSHARSKLDSTMQSTRKATPKDGLNAMNSAA